jgi:hypothetical protein
MASPSTYMPDLREFVIPETAGAASVAFTVPIPPPGSGIGNSIAGNANPNSIGLLTAPSGGFIHVNKAIATCTAAQVLALLTPLNWTTLATDGTATTTTSASITLTNDPGLYATKYRTVTGIGTGYSPPLFPNAPALADNAIAANDFVMFQAADGTWYADKVAGVAGSTTITVGLTNGMPSSKAGSLCYFFGLVADKDPATGLKRPQTTLAASSARAEWPGLGSVGPICNTLFAGDPVLVHGINTDQSLVLNYLGGYYSWR